MSTYVDSIGRTYTLTDPVARFWSKVDTAGECWLWLGYVDSTTGYGRFSVQHNHETREWEPTGATS